MVNLPKIPGDGIALVNACEVEVIEGAHGLLNISADGNAILALAVLHDIPDQGGDNRSIVLAEFVANDQGDLALGNDLLLNGVFKIPP